MRHEEFPPSSRKNMPINILRDSLQIGLEYLNYSVYYMSSTLLNGSTVLGHQFVCKQNRRPRVSVQLSPEGAFINLRVQQRTGSGPFPQPPERLERVTTEVH